jgi:phage terminase small subunit
VDSPTPRVNVHAPSTLKSAGKKLWRETVKTYDLRQDELETLKAACGEADLIFRMEEALEDAPLTVQGSQGQLVAHPLVQELRQHRTAMASLLRGLKLPDEGSAAPANQQRDAANSRWAVPHGKSA